MQRIVFLRTDRLGETLLNIPVLAGLKATLPRASITCVVQPMLEPLMQSAPGVDSVMSYAPGPRRWWWARAVGLGWRLRQRRFEIAIVSNPSKELHLAVWLAGIPLRVGYDRKWGGLLTHRVPDRKALGERHEVEYNLDLIRALGLPTPIPQWQLPRFDREQVEVLQLLEREGVKSPTSCIAVHPWTSNPVKQWPLDRFQQVMRHCIERLGLVVIVIGGAEERAKAQHVAAAPGVVNLTGRLTLVQLAALLQQARLLISNDSGPVHLAAAVGTKTVVLFGTSTPATGPRRWGPWGTGHALIWKPSMEDINVEEVVEAVGRSLTR